MGDLVRTRKTANREMNSLPSSPVVIFYSTLGQVQTPYTSHDPNRMLMRENKGLFSFAFDSASVKYGV